MIRCRRELRDGQISIADGVAWATAGYRMRSSSIPNCPIFCIPKSRGPTISDRRVSACSDPSHGGTRAKQFIQGIDVLVSRSVCLRPQLVA